MKLMKVFDSRCPMMPGPVWDTSHTLSIEYHGNGNDSYYSLDMSGEEDGGGYVSMSQIVALQDWCRNLGAEDGETVLIYHWW